MRRADGYRPYKPNRGRGGSGLIAVPADIMKHLTPDMRFSPVFTDEGILYKPMSVDETRLPDWLESERDHEQRVDPDSNVPRRSAPLTQKEHRAAMYARRGGEPPAVPMTTPYSSVPGVVPARLGGTRRDEERYSIADLTKNDREWADNQRNVEDEEWVSLFLSDYGPTCQHILKTELAEFLSIPLGTAQARTSCALYHMLRAGQINITGEHPSYRNSKVYALKQVSNLQEERERRMG